MFLGLFVFVSLLFGANVTGISASIEDDIFRFLRGVGSRIELIQTYQGWNHREDLGRFDAIETKLDRLYESCGRGGTATSARRATLAQTNACIDACFTSTAVGQSSEGAVGRQTFVSCVARCPSNTLRNIECANNYVNYASFGGGVVLANGEVVEGARTPAAYVRECAVFRGAAQEPMCRVYAELFRSNLGACLFDQTAYTCQSDCQRNFRNEAGFILCQLRCQNRTRASERFEQLQNAGFLTEDGRLSMNTLSNTLVSPTVPSVPAVPQTDPATTITVPTPSAETYSQCVYRCGDERTTCLAAPPAGQSCETNYSACYQGCNTRLLPGGTAR